MWSEYRALIEYQIAAGTTALVINGTTAEAATLTGAERLQALRVAVDTVAGRLPIIAGTGHQATAKTIAATHRAFSEGADACLIVTPYYNRPPQEGLQAHFQAISTAVRGPLLLYNVPKRTGADLAVETVRALSQDPYIIGIKEASEDPEKIGRLRQACAEDFLLYGGNDEQAITAFAQGAAGLISVTANVAPDIYSRFCNAAYTGQRELSRVYQEQLQPLNQALACATNPIPVKWALAELGLISGGIRLPLVPLHSRYHPLLRQALTHLALYGDHHAPHRVT